MFSNKNRNFWHVKESCINNRHFFQTKTFTYDDRTSLICSMSLTVGTIFAIALPSIANKLQLITVNTEITDTKYTAKQNKKDCDLRLGNFRCKLLGYGEMWYTH